MMLTNYPIDRALVAERQRERLGYADRTRRTRGTRGGNPTLPSTTRWRFTSWLLGRSLQRRDPEARDRCSQHRGLHHVSLSAAGGVGSRRP